MSSPVITGPIAADHLSQLRREACLARLGPLARCCQPHSWDLPAVHRLVGDAGVPLNGSTDAAVVLVAELDGTAVGAIASSGTASAPTSCSCRGPRSSVRPSAARYRRTADERRAPTSRCGRTARSTAHHNRRELCPPLRLHAGRSRRIAGRTAGLAGSIHVQKCHWNPLWCLPAGIASRVMLRWLICWNRWFFGPRRSNSRPSARSMRQGFLAA